MFDIDYTNYYSMILEKNQHKILGRVERDKATLRLSAMVAVQIADERISEEVAVQRSRLVTAAEKELLWLLDICGDLNLDDLKKVKIGLLELLQKPSGKIVETADKAMPAEVIGKLAEHIRTSEELISPDGKTILIPPIFTRNGYGYIRTKQFTEFISHNKDMGWSRLEVLKLLKRNHLLQVGKNRTYDKKVRVNKRCNNYYVIRLPQDKSGQLLIEEPDETIEIKLKGEH